jgi:hypothetical protein
MLFFTTLYGLFTLICAKEVPKFLCIHAKKTKRFGAVNRSNRAVTAPNRPVSRSQTELKGHLNSNLNLTDYPPVTDKPVRFTATGPVGGDRSVKKTLLASRDSRPQVCSAEYKHLQRKSWSLV